MKKLMKVIKCLPAIFVLTVIFCVLFTTKAAYANTDATIVITDADSNEHYLEHYLKSTEKSGEGWEYDSKSMTITLENFKGKKIEVSAGNGDPLKLTVVLKGTSVFTEGADFGYGKDAGETHFKGDGVLKVTGSYWALSGDVVFLEDSVHIYSSATDSDGYLAKQTNIGKNAVIEVCGLEFGYRSGGSSNRDYIAGTIIAKITNKDDWGQAFYYTSYNTELASDRHIYGGPDENNLHECKIVSDSWASYMDYDKDGSLKYVIVSGKRDTSSSKTTVPKVSISKVSSPKVGTVKVSYKKAKDVDGYIIYYATSKSGKYKKAGTVKDISKTAFSFGKLKSGKKYYIKVRAYKKVNGKTVYGDFSAVKSVKTK